MASLSQLRRACAPSRVGLLRVVSRSRRSAIGEYVRSTRNSTGLALAVVGPALALVGVFPLAAAVALALPLYAIGALVAPPRRDPELVSGVGIDDVRESLDGIRIRIRGHVSLGVEARVRRLSATISEALPRAQSLPRGSKARFVLAKTATDYLPSSLQPYLDLPRAYAEQEVVAGGKTPAALLCDQLDLLTAQMNLVVEAIRRSDTDRIMTNGRFLAERFAPGALSLGVPED
jgi:hypothetical protein